MVFVKPVSRYGGTYWYPQEAEVSRWGVQVHLGFHTEVPFQTETYSYSGEARPSLGSPARQSPLTELVSKYEEELVRWMEEKHMYSRQWKTRV